MHGLQRFGQIRRKCHLSITSTLSNACLLVYQSVQREMATCSLLCQVDAWPGDRSNVNLTVFGMGMCLPILQHVGSSKPLEVFRILQIFRNWMLIIIASLSKNTIMWTAIKVMSDRTKWRDERNATKWNSTAAKRRIPKWITYRFPRFKFLDRSLDRTSSSCKVCPVIIS